MKKVLLILMAFSLTGCGANLVLLAAHDPQATDFNSSLAAEYLAYAESMSEQDHPVLSEYYADKGLKALSGEPVPPEQAKDDDKAVIEGRKQLLAVLTDDVKSVAPQKLARAQLLFDCWQQQHRTGGNVKKAPCAEEFSASLAEVQEVADSFIHGKSSHPKHRRTRAPKDTQPVVLSTDPEESAQ